MSIVLSLKVNDGLVLAADSATTIATVQGQVENVYDNGNKVLNLRKVWPIGLLTWGGGGIGNASIATLAKDLRQRLTDVVPGHEDWQLQEHAYTIEEVAARVRQFMFEENYMPAFQPGMENWSTGFIVAGYSAGAPMAEAYEIVISGDHCEGPTLISPLEDCGLCWRAQPEAICRLVLGFGMGLPSVLEEDLGVPPEQIEPAMSIIRDRLQVPLWHSAMPIQDAINLAEFLVDLTINFSRYLPGAQVVGGPIEIAAITKHEGFKWIKRKHYYSQGLNLGGQA